MRWMEIKRTAAYIRPTPVRPNPTANTSLQMRDFFHSINHVHERTLDVAGANRCMLAQLIPSKMVDFRGCLSIARASTILGGAKRLLFTFTSDYKVGQLFEWHSHWTRATGQMISSADIERANFFRPLHSQFVHAHSLIRPSANYAGNRGGWNVPISYYFNEYFMHLCACVCVPPCLRWVFALDSNNGMNNGVIATW